MPFKVMKSLASMFLTINICTLAKQFTYLRDKWPCYSVPASEYSFFRRLDHFSKPFCNVVFQKTMPT